MVITGGIATGKSTFLTLLQKNSYSTINCDTICAQVFHNNKNKIIAELGPSIIKDDQIYRPYVRSLIFSNKVARLKLEKIIHPKLYFNLFVEVIKNFFRDKDIVYIEVPLFFECKLDKFFDAILIYCTRDEQIQRILMRDGENNYKNMLNSQMCIEEKRRRARYVIYNVRSLEDLENNIESMKFGGNRMSSYVFILMIIILMLNVESKF